MRPVQPVWPVHVHTLAGAAGAWFIRTRSGQLVVGPPNPNANPNPNTNPMPWFHVKTRAQQ